MPFNQTSPSKVPYYGGGQVANPANVISVTAAPSTAATENPIGTIAINPTAGTAYMAVKNTGINGTVTWDQLGLSTGSVGSITGNSGGAITPTAGNINLLGAGNVSVTGSGSTLTISIPPDGLAVNDVTGTTQTLAINNAYIADNAGLVTFTLPATAAQGSYIQIIGNGAGGWTIAQNANQVIKVASQTTTTGVNGSLSSGNRYDCIQLFASVGGASTTWVALNSSGTFTLV